MVSLVEGLVRFPFICLAFGVGSLLVGFFFAAPCSAVSCLVVPFCTSRVLFGTLVLFCSIHYFLLIIIIIIIIIIINTAG